MYSFEQLKVFVTVCDTGSFSAAARKLKRAQSGVSQSISNLEIAIDQTLFSREKNTPQITDNGKALLPVARSILNQQHYFDQKVESLSQSQEHELVIAVEESLLNDELLKILAPLADQYPITRFDIFAAPTFDIEKLVSQGKAHLGIIYADGELKVDMDFFLLGQARFLTIASPNHQLSQLNCVTEYDLKNHRQCTHRNADKKELWFTYAISTRVWYANTHQALIDMVVQGLGWAIVPEILIRQPLEQGKISVLPISHEKSGWLTPVGCLVSRTNAIGPVTSAVISELQRHQMVSNQWR